MRILTIAFLLTSLVFCLPLCTVAQNTPAKTLTFTDISGIFPLIPLAVSKSAIAGFMCCQSDAAYEDIDFPKATATTADGIDDQGEIVGSYFLSHNPAHGYLAK